MYLIIIYPLLFDINQGVARYSHSQSVKKLKTNPKWLETALIKADFVVVLFVTKCNILDASV